MGDTDFNVVGWNQVVSLLENEQEEDHGRTYHKYVVLWGTFPANLVHFLNVFKAEYGPNFSSNLTYKVFEEAIDEEDYLRIDVKTTKPFKIVLSVLLPYSIDLLSILLESDQWILADLNCGHLLTDIKSLSESSFVIQNGEDFRETLWHEVERFVEQKKESN